MKKIIFPTNFSTRTDKVFSYARHFAKHMDTEIIVYHATTETEVPGVGKATDDFISGQDTFDSFDAVIDASDTKEINVSYILEKGVFIETFPKFITTYQDDLIVMGTDGHDSVSDYFWNTNTINVFKNTRTNLLAVPKTVSSNGKLRKIVYLTNYNIKEDQESLTKIMNLLQGHDYEIDVLHFDVAHTEMYTQNMAKLQESLVLPEMDRIIFKSIDTIDIVQSLKEYKHNNNIDTVAITSHHRSHYERIFFNSLTESLITELKVPILSLYS